MVRSVLIVDLSLCLAWSSIAATPVGSSSSWSILNRTPVECSSDQFRCNSGKCILGPYVCDGQPDCFPTGEDEKNCTRGSRLRSAIDSEYYDEDDQRPGPTPPTPAPSTWSPELVTLPTPKHNTTGESSQPKDFIDEAFSLWPVAQEHDYWTTSEDEVFRLPNLSFKACIDQCSSYRDCDVVVMKNAGRVCIGKKWVGHVAMIKDSCCDVYNVKGKQDPRFSLVPVIHNMDYLNGDENDLFRLQSTSLAECKAKCAETPNCELVIMVHDRTDCLGKGWKGLDGLASDRFHADIHFMGAIGSGRGRLGFLPPGGVEYNSGSDVFEMTSPDGKSLSQCSAKCTATPGCDFVFMNYQSGHCFGKVWTGLEGFGDLGAHAFTKNGEFIY